MKYPWRCINLIEIIVVFLGVLGVIVAIVGLFMSYIRGLKKVQKNDISHIHARIDVLVDDLSDLKERVARVEESIIRIDKKINTIKT